MLTREAAFALAGWQLCSVLLTITGYCSTSLSRRGIDAPTAQSVAAYILLSTHGLVVCRRQRRAGSVTESDNSVSPNNKLHQWQWILLAAADVEANYLLVFAYQFTDMTSVSLLDAFTIPMAMLISCIGFGARYSKRQLVAAAICIGGLAILLVNDFVRVRKKSEDEGRLHNTTLRIVYFVHPLRDPPAMQTRCTP